MSDRVTLVVAKETGHVLAVATRRTAPDGEVEPAQLVGDGLQIRDPANGAVLLTVEPDSLDVKTADGIDDLLLQPRIYIVKDGQPIVGTTGVTATASPTGVAVTLPAAPAQEAKAWVQVEGGTPPLRLTQSAKTTVANVTLNMTLQAGTTYQILALVEGHQAELAANVA